MTHTPEEIKPCPFCGSDELIICKNDGYEFIVGCWDCGAGGPDNRLKYKAIRAWNQAKREER